MRVNSGKRVSSRLKRELSVTWSQEERLDNKTTIRVVPQIRIPPIVGVPCFLACSSLKITASSPVEALSRSCLPILYLWSMRMKGGASSSEIMKAKINDPKIRIK